MTLQMMGKDGQGSTWTEKAGAKVEKTVPVKGPKFVFDGPTANVNVSLGARIGLPDYSDFRCGASLTLPCDPADIDEAFDFAKAWVEARCEELTELVGT